MVDTRSVRVRPERFVAGGEALARDEDGRVVFVRGAVPGDDVEVAVIEDRGDWLRGVVTKVVEPGPDRVAVPCIRRSAGCGGCDWQHLAESAQLPAKVQIVRDALRRTGKLPDARLQSGGSVAHRAYRTTIRVVGDEDGRPSFRRDRSHDTVPASGCLVAHPALDEALARVRLTPGLDLTLRVSDATGEMTARWSRARGRVDGLPGYVATGPDASLQEEVAGHRLRVSAASFFQSGPQAAALLVETVARAAPELVSAEVVVDAYAGVGLLAVASAPPAARVIAVESSRSAVADCRVNLAGRDARVERVQVGRWRPGRDESVDVVLADPARSGLGRPGMAAVVRASPGVVVLVSCDPVALARDAHLLGRHGYQHRGTEVLDLFPHTHHVECVTRFVRV